MSLLFFLHGLLLYLFWLHFLLDYRLLWPHASPLWLPISFLHLPVSSWPVSTIASVPMSFILSTNSSLLCSAFFIDYFAFQCLWTVSHVFNSLRSTHFWLSKFPPCISPSLHVLKPYSSSLKPQRRYSATEQVCVSLVDEDNSVLPFFTLTSSYHSNRFRFPGKRVVCSSLI